MDSIKNINSCDPIVKLIVEWCTDDNGINVLYKNNGAERYPGSGYLGVANPPKTIAVPNWFDGLPIHW